MDPGLVGLALSNALTVTNSMSYLVSWVDAGIWNIFCRMCKHATNGWGSLMTYRAGASCRFPFGTLAKNSYQRFQLKWKNTIPSTDICCPRTKSQDRLGQASLPMDHWRMVLKIMRSNHYMFFFSISSPSSLVAKLWVLDHLSTNLNRIELGQG